MNDPYKILGVSRDADDTEIKKAYRALSKKYHPDNNPGNQAAEEVFKQVQMAYEQIMKERKEGPSTGSFNGFSGFEGFEGFGNFNGFEGRYTYSGDNTQSKAAQDLKSAYVYIQNGYYDQALNVLNDMDAADRDDRWYYYSAISNLKTGSNITALEHAKQALSMRPDNYEYQRLVSSIESGADYYTNRSAGFSINPVSGGSWCFKVILCNLALNLLCGGGGMCCGNGMGGGAPFYPGM